MKRVVLTIPAVLGLLAAASPGTAIQAASSAPRSAVSMAATTASPIRFGPTTVVDDQRAAGEPGTKICGPTTSWSLGNCGGDNPYDTAPWGFSTTSTFIWRSEDRAHTFKLVPSNLATGKPTACPGGGDSDIAVSPGASQSADYLNFIDLQALTNFSSGVSRNGGQLFTCNPVAALDTAVDRQWFGVYRNPAGASLAGGNGAIVYLDYDIIAQHPACFSDTAANGNTFVVQKSTDGGTTWSTAAIADCNDGIAGNLQVNQHSGHVFGVHTAFSSPAQSVATDQVTVNRSIDFGTTWTRAKVFSCDGTCVVGNDFAVLAIDKLGGLYSVWSQAPTDGTGAIRGPSHIFYAYSGDDGQTWTPEQQVDHGSTDVNVFAWVAAGNAGAIDVVWYGTKAAVPTYESGAQITDWFPYLAQSLNANGSGASFTAPVPVSQHPNHNGGICTNGIGCTAGGDRSLADFFQVDINQAGGADVTWADTSNNGSNHNNQAALIDHARQIAGPTLYGGSGLNGSLVVCTAVASGPCQPDPTGDARYEANGVIGSNTPKLDITGSSVNLDPGDPSRLLVRLHVANLSTLPGPADGPVAGGPYVDYLTSWNYHIPGGTQATFDSTGNIYYAYLEVNSLTGMVTSAFDGNTCSGLETTHPKTLVYPGQNPITYRIDTANGTIDLYVPRADIGSPPVGATLYSVTAHTVSQPAPAGPAPASCSVRDLNNNNPDPAGQIFNVYDKSAAYTSVLTVSSGTGCQEGDGGGEIHGKGGGNASFQSDEDGCKDGDVNGEQFKDPGSNEDFQSTELRSVQHDNVARTMTVSGVGLSNGLPVTYVIVEQAATALTPALYTIQLSDGYVNTGSLLSGTITLN